MNLWTLAMPSTTELPPAQHSRGRLFKQFQRRDSADMSTVTAS